MWWPFKKTSEKRLLQAFMDNLRVVQVSLHKRLKSQYSSEVGEEFAGVLAAQVVNYLKGEDIEIVLKNSTEPLKSKIAGIKDQVPRSAERAMAESRSTREVVVATLRMRTVLEYMQHGETYHHSDEHKRIYKLLSTYGPEFPEEIKPQRYTELAERYREECFPKKV